MEGHVALHAFVSGRVQGVFFRDSTRQRAQVLGLSGWARNLPDGRVEVMAVGPRTACESLLEFLRTGPPRASVSNVEVRWEPAPASAPREFEIR